MVVLECEFFDEYLYGFWGFMQKLIIDFPERFYLLLELCDCVKEIGVLC